MGHDLWLHFGSDEHPYATYFDLHQGQGFGLEPNHAVAPNECRPREDAGPKRQGRAPEIQVARSFLGETFHKGHKTNTQAPF